MARRNSGGKIEGDENARSYEETGGKFWRGTHGNVAKLGKEFSDALDGKGTNSRGMTRSKIAKQLASLIRSGTIDEDDFFSGIGIDARSDPLEAEKILVDLERGKMPPANPQQRTGEENAWEYKTHLHHKKPRHKGGPVHALWNLLFVSPRHHEEILDEEYHYGEYHGKKAKERKEAKEDKRREQIQLGQEAEKERKRKRGWLSSLFGPIGEDDDPDWDQLGKWG